MKQIDWLAGWLTSQDSISFHIVSTSLPAKQDCTSYHIKGVVLLSLVHCVSDELATNDDST